MKDPLRTSGKIIWVLALLIVVIGAAAGVYVAVKHTGHQAKAGTTLYTCGMHPQVIQDHPGLCPICHMKLTPVKRATSEGNALSEAASTSNIGIDPVTIQNMGIRTTEVKPGPLRRTIRTVGVIDYDETMLAEVSTKFRGWIEKLYVDATGKQVHRGEPLFEIYSPELYSAQTEYLLAGDQATNHARPNPLKQSALQKLKFFDISNEQIEELTRTHEPKKTLRVGAPIDGFVTEKMVVEGMMAEAGMKLYRLADLGIVWVYGQLYEQDLPYVQLGQEATVTLSYMSGRKFRGRVTYIYPNVDEKTRTVRVRMEFHNPGYLLKPGMFASVEMATELKEAALLVPDVAVLRSGEKNTVFVALDGGHFEPRTVLLGARAEEDQYEVLGGLTNGERVVTSGQFMLDSESQMREAIQKMVAPQASSTEETNLTAAVAASETSATRSSSVYICPMPEHMAIEYERPGKCPLCGMTLVPVGAELLARIQPGGSIEAYTCPMPEDKDVRSDKPGKCPKCNMTMIPVMTKPKVEPPKEPAALPPLYTCPMEIHADVVSDKPGKCTKCDMELVRTTTVKHGKISEGYWRKKQASAAKADSLQSRP